MHQQTWKGGALPVVDEFIGTSTESIFWIITAQENRYQCSMFHVDLRFTKPGQIFATISLPQNWLIYVHIFMFIQPRGRYVIIIYVDCVSLW